MIFTFDLFVPEFDLEAYPWGAAYICSWDIFFGLCLVYDYKNEVFENTLKFWLSFFDVVAALLLIQSTRK